MEKRRHRSSKARRGSERRHWSRYFYDSNAQKPDSVQCISRPLDAQSSSSTIIGDGSRHRSFPELPTPETAMRLLSRSSSCSSTSSPFLELGLPKPRTSAKLSTFELTKSRRSRPSFLSEQTLCLRPSLFLPLLIHLFHSPLVCFFPRLSMSYEVGYYLSIFIIFSSLKMGFSWVGWVKGLSFVDISRRTINTRKFHSESVIFVGARSVFLFLY